MKTETFSCDGINCDKKTHNDHECKNWLEISQPIKDPDWWSLKLDETLCFCSIDCLASWSAKAAIITEKLSSSNQYSPHPKGCIRTKEFPGVYV